MRTRELAKIDDKITVLEFFGIDYKVDDVHLYIAESELKWKGANKNDFQIQTRLVKISDWSVKKIFAYCRNIRKELFLAA